MIPNNTKVIDTIANTFGGERVKMEIDPRATAHLMSLLTDLYSDQELACIREYSTNAWDSHIDAGTTHKPIVVNTPGPLSQFFTVQDFGVGMDADDIRNIYSQYGRSTKREQTTTNGSMGIGAKAALSYASQFTVTGVKDGIKTLVAVYRENDGTGTMEIITTSATDEDNGVTISIPSKGGDRFQSKAEHFFKFWPKGRVLLNGTDPSVEMEKFSDRIYLVENASNDYVFMGNVAYPIADTHRISHRSSGSYVVFHSTMNGDDEVVFTPSREGLIYDDITKNALAGARKEYNAALSDFYTNKILSAKNYREAFAVWSKANSLFGYYVRELNLPRAYDGMTLESVYNHVTAMVWRVHASRYSVSAGQQISTSELISQEDSDTTKNVLFVKGYPYASVASNHKSRIKDYFYSKGISRLRKIAFVNDATVDTIKNDKRLDGTVIYDWEDIKSATKAPPRPRPATPGFSYGGKYDVWDPKSETFQIEALSKGDKVLYWHSAKNTSHLDQPDMETLRMMVELYPGYKFVKVSKNREGKLVSDFGAVKYSRPEVIEKCAAIAYDKMTDEDFFKIAVITFYNSSTLKMPYWHGEASKFVMALDNCLDQDYARLIKAFYSKYEAPAMASHDSRYDDRVRKTVGYVTGFNKNPYPLVCEQTVKHSPDALVEYINHEYTKRNGA